MNVGLNIPPSKFVFIRTSNNYPRPLAGEGEGEGKFIRLPSPHSSPRGRGGNNSTNTVIRMHPTFTSSPPQPALH